MAQRARKEFFKNSRSQKWFRNTAPKVTACYFVNTVAILSGRQFFRVLTKSHWILRYRLTAFKILSNGVLLSRTQATFISGGTHPPWAEKTITGMVRLSG